MALMNLKHVSTDGKTLQEHAFKCGRCKNDVPCSLVFVEGGIPCPYDLPLYCQTCFAFVGLINANPSTVLEPPDPSRDFMAETAEVERELERERAELGKLEHEIDQQQPALEHAATDQPPQE